MAQVSGQDSLALSSVREGKPRELLGLLFPPNPCVPSTPGWGHAAFTLPLPTDPRPGSRLGRAAQWVGIQMQRCLPLLTMSRTLGEPLPSPRLSLLGCKREQ